MRKNRVWRLSVLLTTLLAALLTACGGSSVDQAPPPPAQTGDTTLFVNAGLLSSATTLDTAGVIILDARSEADYNLGHIPGALSAPPSKFTVVGGGENELLSVAELEAVLGAMGITRTSKIVVYDNTTASLGAGGRLFWMLEYLGCTDVSILNGGWDQWLAQGRTTESAALTHAAVAAVTFSAMVDAAISIDIANVKAVVDAKDGTVLLVDARTAPEYTGPDMLDTTRPGHIPGAINLPYTACYNADKTVLNFNDLKVLFESHGITKDKYVIVYSTVGKRSAFIYFLARLMGYTQVANYCGSAAEWASLDPVAYPLTEGAVP